MKRIFILTFFVIFNGICFAKCKWNCEASYTGGKTYKVEITFMTGDELNKAIDSVGYDITKGYAIIFWGYGQASIIELTYTCFRHGFGGLNVYTCDMLEMCKGFLNGKLEGYDNASNHWTIKVL